MRLDLEFNGGVEMAMDFNPNAAAFNATAGAGMMTSYNDTELRELIAGLSADLAGKQATLVAGDNIQINGNVISAAGGEIPTKTSDLVNDSGYLTQHQSLEAYALKTELPSPYNDSELRGLIAGKADADHSHSQYLTQHQSLIAYAKTSDIPTKTSDIANDSGYITAADVPAPYNDTAVRGLISGKQDKLTAGANISIVNNVISASGGGGTAYDDTEIRSLINGKADAEHAHEQYATHDEIPDAYDDTAVRGLIDAKADADHTHSQYLTQHQSLAAYSTTAQADAKYQPKGAYLTEHQSLSGYAKTADIPTVPTAVSAFTNDAGYITAHQSLAGYAKTTDIPTDAHINSLIDAAIGDYTIALGGLL